MDKYGVVSDEVGDIVTDKKLGKGKVVSKTVDGKNPTVSVQYGTERVDYTLDGVSNGNKGTVLE